MVVELDDLRKCSKARFKKVVSKNKDHCENNRHCLRLNLNEKSIYLIVPTVNSKNSQTCALLLQFSFFSTCPTFQKLVVVQSETDSSNCRHSYIILSSFFVCLLPILSHAFLYILSLLSSYFSILFLSLFSLPDLSYQILLFRFLKCIRYC